MCMVAGGLSADEHPVEGELKLLVGEAVLTKNPLSILNKLGQLEVALYVAGAKANPAQRHPLEVSANAFFGQCLPAVLICPLHTGNL